MEPSNDGNNYPHNHPKASDHAAADGKPTAASANTAGANQAQRIVILGGGFGGIYTAIHLARLWRGGAMGAGIEIVLVSRDNYFLMTPLLFEAGSGVLEPRHSVSPIRLLFKRRGVRFVNAEIQRVDFDRRIVFAAPAGNAAYELPFDHLVIALGGVTNTKIIPGSQHAITFKTLADAIFLRNHVIDLFERADVEMDPARKAVLLRFAIIGGGLVATELAGELTEFLKNLSRSYPRIDYARDVKIVVVESGKSLMPEMDPSLRDYATQVLRDRGVDVRLNTPAKAIEPGKVHLPEGDSIETETIVLAAGVAANPLLADFPVEKEHKGRLAVGSDMRSKSHPQVWALGDCAAIPNPNDPDGKPYPQLAQHALREAKVLAGNITAVLRGQPTKPFIYKTMGMMAALGHYKGVGKVMKLHLYGFIAWWAWRSYYLLQMPRWSRRFRIMLDWTTALLFSNDIVKLDLFGGPHPLAGYAKQEEELNHSEPKVEEKV